MVKACFRDPTPTQNAQTIHFGLSLVRIVYFKSFQLPLQHPQTFGVNNGPSLIMVGKNFWCFARLEICTPGIVSVKILDLSVRRKNIFQLPIYSLTEISTLLFQPNFPKSYIHNALSASKLSMSTSFLILLYLFSRSYACMINLMLQVQQLKYLLVP